MPEVFLARPQHACVDGRCAYFAFGCFDRGLPASGKKAKKHGKEESSQTLRASCQDLLVGLPEGSGYPILEVSGSEKHTINGCRDQKPQILGTWTLWGCFRELGSFTICRK